MSNEVTFNYDILAVNDSIFFLQVIRGMLQDSYTIRIAQSPETAFSLISERTPDLILLGCELSKISGLEFLLILKDSPKWKDIPVIFFTGDSDHEKEEKALSLGAADYILKHVPSGVLKKRLQLHLESAAHRKQLKKMLDLKTKQLLETQDHLVKTQKLAIDILANITTFRDSDTGAHITRTSGYVRIIVGELMKARLPGYILSDEYARNIINSAKLHDIGKIAIPDGVLLKTTRLRAVEFEIMKMHTVFGAQFLERSMKQTNYENDFLITAREIILHHHEWWNGQGYPERLKNSEIPLSARIMAIADIYDALISDRPYKKAISHEEAVDTMRKESETHLDPILLSAVEKSFPRFYEISRSYKDE